MAYWEGNEMEEKDPQHDRPEQWLSVREVALLWSVHPRTIRNWIQKGVLPAAKLGRQVRIARSEIEAFTAAYPIRSL